MGVLSIADAIAKLGEMTIAVNEAQHAIMTRACRVVQREAKAEIGHYQEQAGWMVAWADLADSTKADRVRKGYPEDEPLLREGDLRDSIEIAVRDRLIGGETHGAVGSNSDIAVYQELGTSRIPPRSFLGGAAFRKSEEVAELLGSEVVTALVGRNVWRGRLPISGGETGD